MKKSHLSSEKPDRKTMEKNRRMHMKGLCRKLSSLIPSLSSQPHKKFTQGEQFDHSVAYIKQLRKRIEGLKEKRDEISRLLNAGDRNNFGCSLKDDRPAAGSDNVRLRMVEVKELDTGLQVLLISRLRRNFTFCEVVGIVEDGGAEVVKASYTTVGDKVFYTLHAWARVSRIGVEMTSIYERLQNLIN